MIKSELIDSFDDQSKLLTQWFSDLEASPSNSLPSSPFNSNVDYLYQNYQENQFQLPQNDHYQYQEYAYQYDGYQYQQYEQYNGNQYYNSNYYQQYPSNDYCYPQTYQNFDHQVQHTNSIDFENSNISNSISGNSFTETDEDDLIEQYESSSTYTSILNTPSQAKQSRKRLLSNQLEESVSGEIGMKRKRKRILNRFQRAEATMREKRRMLKLNKAFEELRKVLPISEFAKNKLSRSETLKSAIEYIERMSQLLTL
ncbi:unnamed protein product [Brachionus calyciflorus]|uniref:BHLH domain-containing protein n=1 Tax=Brachionus calyciflorus TaxID=104777 RepID=A0A813NAQ3_9BILA|nr:unnamed protein product [Brachionus calyciflorus]